MSRQDASDTLAAESAACLRQAGEKRKATSLVRIHLQLSMVREVLP